MTSREFIAYINALKRRYGKFVLFYDKGSMAYLGQGGNIPEEEQEAHKTGEVSHMFSRIESGGRDLESGQNQPTWISVS